jgi:hypothetical protein
MQAISDISGVFASLPASETKSCRSFMNNPG